MKISLSSITFAVCLVFSNHLWAHGANVPIDEDSCSVFRGANIVHFSAYQPTIDEKSQYCEKIPSLGKTIIVADLYNEVLRHIPVSLRIMKTTGDKEEVLASLPLEVHSNGVLELPVDLPANGKYTAIVETEGEIHEIYQFPLIVGPASFGPAGMSGNLIFLLILIIGFLGFMVYRTRKRQASASAEM